MAVTETEVRTRRGVLAGALGAAAALALDALGRPRHADAANGDTMKVGQSHSASNLTSVTSSSNGLKGRATGAGGVGVFGETTSATGRGVRGFASATSGVNFGVHGESKSGSGAGVNGFNNASSGEPMGVRGISAGSGIGVYGNAGRGVVGETANTIGTGVVAKNTATTGTGNGLRALAFAPGAEAVYAENSAAGGAGHAINAISSTDTVVKVENVSGLTATNVGLQAKAINQGLWGIGKEGVYGETGATDPSVTNAVGVKGEANAANHFGGHFRNISNNGFALRVQGGLRLEGAGGIANIGAGASSVVVTPTIPFRSTSFVVATLQSDPGGGRTVARVVVGASSFTIHLTGNTTNACTVAWIMAN